MGANERKAGGGNQDSDRFGIGEISRKVNLTPRTIRYYEDIGLLNSIKRVEGGRRVYTEDDVRRLKFIKRLKLLGLSLDEMRELEELYLSHRSNAMVLPRLIELLNRHLESIGNRMDQLKILQRDIEAYKEHIHQKL